MVRPLLNIELRCFERETALSLSVGVSAAIYQESDSVHVEWRVRDPKGVILWDGKGVSSDALWTGTCFELFISVAGTDAYDEWNLAPDGRWNQYRFSKYRERAADPRRDEAPQTSWMHGYTERLFQFRIPARLPAKPLLGLSMMMQAQYKTEQRLLHWAIRHGEEKPDFHAKETWSET